jgi:hypothetical protein
MKRDQHKTSSKRHGRSHVIEPGRLTEVRGGRDLGIAVAGSGVIADITQIQHNEALIGL